MSPHATLIIKPHHQRILRFTIAEIVCFLYVSRLRSLSQQSGIQLISTIPSNGVNSELPLQGNCPSACLAQGEFKLDSKSTT